eukprot:1317954-Amorphochlora_amoeboformis.AAC.1
MCPVSQPLGFLPLLLPLMRVWIILSSLLLSGILCHNCPLLGSRGCFRSRRQARCRRVAVLRLNLGDNFLSLIKDLALPRLAAAVWRRGRAIVVIAVDVPVGRVGLGILLEH